MQSKPMSIREVDRCSIEDYNRRTILVDEDTGVMYLQTTLSHNGGLAVSVIPLLDPDGKPKLIGKEYYRQ